MKQMWPLDIDILDIGYIKKKSKIKTRTVVQNA